MMFIPALLTLNANSQGNKDSLMFAYVMDQEGFDENLGFASSSLNEASDYRYDIAKEVLDQLIMAKGDKNMPEPEFVFQDNPPFAAFTMWENNQVKIGLNPKAYEICVSLGQDSLNALASLLGHEIIHYYEKHEWVSDFTINNRDVHTVKLLRKMNRKGKIQLETQADYLGGFLGYTAGYKTLGVMPSVLEKIYEGYGLDSIVSGYPSLGERKKIAKNSMKLLEEFVMINEMSSYLIAIGDNENARSCLLRILKEFQSPEIYNNLGVSCLREARDLLPELGVKFVLPIELETDLKIFPSEYNAGGEDPIVVYKKKRNKRAKLIEKALQYFEQAKTMNEEYAPAYLNQACALTLIGEYEDAEFWARKAKKYARQQGLSKIGSDVQILFGILSFEFGDSIAAIHHFEKQIKEGNDLALLNKKIAKGGFRTNNPSSLIRTWQLSKIDSVDILQTIENLNEIDEDKVQYLSISSILDMIVITLDGSRIYFIKNDSGIYSGIHITKEGYLGETEHGIRVNDDISKILEIPNYSQNYTIIQDSKGQILLSYSSGMMFLIDENNKVKQWAAVINNKPLTRN